MAVDLSKPSTPSLPVELVIEIIQQAWGSPLTNKDRMHLFCSFCLVSRTWLSIFIRIALADVHITSPTFVSHYFYLLRERGLGDERDNDYQLVNAGATINRLCRSITFRIEEKSLKTLWLTSKPGWTNPDGSHEPAVAVRNFLSHLDDVGPTLPNLRKITLEYVDCSWGFDDLFEISRLYSFPSQIDHLEVKFTGIATPSKLFLFHYPQYHQALTLSYNASQSHIRRLSLSRAPTVVILALVEMCPELEDLEIIDPFTTLSRVALPSTLRTLRLHGTPSLVSGGQHDPWGLAGAMESEGGLFSAGASQRLVMYGEGKTEFLKKLCDRNNVSFVHEPPQSLLL
ncbi:hypothetical protein NLI96_g10615 [Meripilus lineatus]|uniref:F-box domain-containing protein n=1 Tax=Meripilus lineatus TaxID=2056292 RepID=A0AAD5UYE1_9APHY|nr:hypothetical protein NLI96_g10615 [Physisporinus lineatus]